MERVFTIEDKNHAEWQGEYNSYQEAVTELKRRKLISWDEEPNIAPCTSWKTCGRIYEIIEYDTGNEPWTEISRQIAFEISSRQIKWHLE